MSELDIIYSILDNRAEFESFAESSAESAELEALAEFEPVAVEYDPYDSEGMTTYGEAE